MKSSATKIARHQAGFTLIELSVVIIITSLLVAAGIQVATNYFAQLRQAQLERKIDTIQTALAKFIGDSSNSAASFVDYDINFPCPASPVIAPGQPDFGVEQRLPRPSPDASGVQCDTAKGVIAIKNSSGATIAYAGSVPTATIGLSSDNMIDPYGHRFSYVVSSSYAASLSLKGPAQPVGALVIQQYDEGGNVTSTMPNMPFALIHHGISGAGAFSVTGIRSACPAGQRESENCNDDNIFVDANLYRATAEGNPNFYDDTIILDLGNNTPPTATGSKWTDIDLDATTPFNPECQYRAQVESEALFAATGGTAYSNQINSNLNPGNNSANYMVNSIGVSPENIIFYTKTQVAPENDSNGMQQAEFQAAHINANSKRKFRVQGFYAVNNAGAKQTTGPESTEVSKMQEFCY